MMATSRCQFTSIPTFISRKKHFPFLLQRQDSLRSRDNQALSRLRFQISLIHFHLLQIPPKNMPLFADTPHIPRGRTTSFVLRFPRRRRRNRRTVQWFHCIARASSFPFHRLFPMRFSRALPASHSSYNPTSQGTLVAPVTKWRKNPGMAQPPCLQREGKRRGCGGCDGLLSHWRHWRNEEASRKKKHPSLRFPREK